MNTISTHVHFTASIGYQALRDTMDSSHLASVFANNDDEEDEDEDDGDAEKMLSPNK